MKRVILWIGALALGMVLGLMHVGGIDGLMNFIATVYTRLFQLMAVPTIALAVILTLVSFGKNEGAGRIFVQTLSYTLLTTFMASVVGLLLYVWISPTNISLEGVVETLDNHESLISTTYYDHIVNIIPDNIIRPFLEGNVLSLLLIAFAVGLALARMPETEQKAIVVKGIQGLQDVLFHLIRGLIWALPLGIIAFAAQLSAQITQASGGVILDSIGRYVAVILGGNAIQFFIVLPAFLLLTGINPIRTMGKMMPAILMALFTKSSAATLPVTMETAERRLGVSKDVSRFVLPICTTINMNGCAAFILVTSLFVMQNGGIHLTWQTMLLWVFISVITAVGNAGVPMGCFFLTISLMTGMGVPVEIMGVILPIYTIIDMVETAENVWSDSCVCAMVDKKRVRYSTRPAL